jgi:hypothetical protein
MNLRILKPLEASDNLAKLFNAYMAKLDNVEIIFSPFYDSMSRYRKGIDNQDNDLSNKIFRTYELLVLQNSLCDFHKCLLKAIADLEEYSQEFNSDWFDYANTKRMKSIQEGWGKDNDYDEQGNIIFKQDFESLQYYTIVYELSGYIGGNYQDDDELAGEVRGEGIGTSKAVDFAGLTLLVKNKTDFSPFKIFEAIKGEMLPLHQLTESGEIIPMDLADRIENEMNQDIYNANLADLFEWVVDFGCIIREKFEILNPAKNNKKAFQEILQMFYALRDVNPQWKKGGLK